MAELRILVFDEHVFVLILVKFLRDGRRAEFNKVWVGPVFGEPVIDLR